MKNILIEQVVEVICEKGCQSVRDDIARLEDGQLLAETAGLTRYQSVLVLKELQSIMSVYGDTCKADGKLEVRVSATVEDTFDSLPLSTPAKTAFIS